MKFHAIIKSVTTTFFTIAAASVLLGGVAHSECNFFTGWVDNKDGTVKDPRNGLIWKRCAEGLKFENGFCAGHNLMADLMKASSIARESRFLSKSDWRLPTKEEYAAVMGSAEDCKNNVYGSDSAMSKAIASNGLFWTSSPYAGNSSDGWFVYINYGHIDNVKSTEELAVQLVRDSQVLGGKAALEFVNEKVTREYRKAFRAAYSSNEFEQFIKNFRGNDPDKLIPKAEANKLTALARERQERQDAERQRQQWERDRPLREQREANLRMCDAQKKT